jgi:hypothetical protein
VSILDLLPRYRDGDGEEIEDIVIDSKIANKPACFGGSLTTNMTREECRGVRRVRRSGSLTSSPVSDTTNMYWMMYDESGRSS